MATMQKPRSHAKMSKKGREKKWMDKPRSLHGNVSHWDRLPIELKDYVYVYASPLTLFLNGRIEPLDALDRRIVHKIWVEALDSDWHGDLATLPKFEGQVPLVNADLAVVKSRSMYARLCQLLPEASESNDMFVKFDETINRDCAEDSSRQLERSRVFATVLDQKSLRLLHIPMRNMWLDVIGGALHRFPYAYAAMCVVEGHASLLRHLMDSCAVDMSRFGPQQPRVFSMRSATTTALDVAARRGHLDVVRILHAAGIGDASSATMDDAATNGHLGVLSWLHDHVAARCTHAAMDGAAANGHLRVVRWLQRHLPNKCSKWAMIYAVCSGHLNIVKFLHQSNPDRYSHLLMDAAASEGHLDIVKFLHSNRSEGCSTSAINFASQRGHLDVVRFLHENRTEGCTTEAIDCAASAGHIDIVRFLLENRSEGFTDNAVFSSKNTEILHMLLDRMDVERKKAILAGARERGLDALAKTLESSLLSHL